MNCNLELLNIVSKCTVNQTFKLFFFFKEVPVFTELSRENDEEKGTFLHV